MASNPPGPTIDAPEALPPGTRFGELEILRVLGAGGFGIVYLALDHALQRHVALKEYMPSALAGRSQGPQVSVRSSSHVETYAVGLRSFVNEARLLAQFNHPSLVKVYRFWEANGTAYMVMPYLQGPTLRDARKAMAAPPGEAWIRSVIDPVLDALALMHRQDVYHRDIAPDNILLPPGEPPVLLDLGAARRAIGDRTQAFTAIVKPSYAPIEQYADAGQQRQGPWTDLYALGAVMYFLLHGRPPTPATARVAHDEGRLLDAAAHPQVSPAFVAAAEWALALRPAERPQSVAELREALDGRLAPPAVAGHVAARDPDTEATVLLPTGTPPYAPTQPLTAPRTAAPPTPPRTAPAAPAAAPPAEPRRRRAPYAAAALGLAAVLAGTAWWFGHTPKPALAAAGGAASSASQAPPEPPAQVPASAGTQPTAALSTVAPAASTAAVQANIASQEKLPAAAQHSPSAVQVAHPHREALPARRTESAAAAETAPTPAPAGTAADVGPSSPREACGRRVLLALAHCMEKQCATPRFQQHPQCARVRAIMEDRRQRIDNGD